MIPNPFWILVIGAIFTFIININGLFYNPTNVNKIEKQKKQMNMILFTTISIIIKLIPIILLIVCGRYKLRIYDVMFIIGLFMIFFVHRGVINKKPMYWNKKYYEKYVKYGIDPTTPLISIINYVLNKSQN
jgi:hypothetical protein